MRTGQAATTLEDEVGHRDVVGWNNKAAPKTRRVSRVQVLRWVVLMSRNWYVVVALSVVAVVGLAAVESAAVDTHTAGMWPIGLASGALLLATRGWRLATLAIVYALGVSTLWLGGRPVEVAVGGGAAIVVTAVVAAWLLRGPDGEQLSLQSDTDLRRYLRASFVSATCGAVVAAGTAAVSNFGSPGVVSLGWGLAALGSQLVLLPLFAALPRHVAVASTCERALQRTLTAVVVAAVLVGAQTPGVAFVVLPLLVWGSVRASPREALVQLVGLVGLAVAITAWDRGPFADQLVNFHPLLQQEGVLLALFVVTTGLIAVPLLVRVGEYVVMATDAAGERDLLQSVVDSATGVAIIVTGQDGRVTVFNPGAQRLLGYSAQEVLGQPTTMLHTKEAVRDKSVELGVVDHYEAVACALIGGRNEGSHMRFLLRDGTERVHAMTLTQLRTRSGVATGRLSTSEDVSQDIEAKRTIVEALEAEHEAVVRLRELDAGKASFVSNVSHELRTPVASILGYSEMLVDGDYGTLESTHHRVVGRISSNSKRLLSLIDDLMTLSQMDEGGGIDLTYADFDLVHVVERACRDMAAAWAAPRRLNVALESPALPVVMSGDRDTIERVVRNLLGNAVKFTPDGGAVRLALGADRHEAWLEVSDTGIGIPADEQHKIFSRFFRSRLAQDREMAGSGLGLAISRSIIEQHGGSLSMTSSVNAGTSISVRLPRRRGAESAA